MPRSISWRALLAAAVVAAGATLGTAALQTAQSGELQQALGTWRSTEQFEGEPRLSFAFQRKGDEIVGWGLLLGQRRKSDDRATLGVSFHGVTWSDNRFRFETLLPEDEGTIGWELIMTAKDEATLRVVTENGGPTTDDLSWNMTR